MSKRIRYYRLYKKDGIKMVDVPELDYYDMSYINKLQEKGIPLTGVVMVNVIH